MNKSSIISSFVKRFAMCGALTAAFLSSAFTAQAQVALDGLDIIGVSNNQVLTDGKITFVLELAEDIASTDFTQGTPYFSLTGISNFSSGATSFKAMCSGNDPDDPTILYFDYEIKPGDFAAAVDITGSLNLAGGKILMADGTYLEDNLSLAKFTPLKDEVMAFGISTFYFDNYQREIVVDSSKTKVNVASSYTIYGDGGEAGVSFIVSVVSTDIISVDVTQTDTGRSGTINSSDGSTFNASLGNSGFMTLTFTPLDEADDVTIRIRPAKAGGKADADLSIKMAKITENFPTIKSVTAFEDNRYTKKGDEITLCVEFDDKVRSVSGTPILFLNVENAHNSNTYSANDALANYAVYDSNFKYSGRNVYFTYKVKPGDYVTKLDAVRLNLNGGAISCYNGNVGPSTLLGLPKGTTAGSLASNNDISIQTIMFEKTGSSLFDMGTVQADVPQNVVVSRGGSVNQEQNFEIIGAPKSGDLATFPTTFTIPAGAANASLPITPLEQGIQTITLKPVGYSDDGGNLTLTMNISPSAIAPTISILGDSEFEEGNGEHLISVLLSKPAKQDITVSVSSSKPECLKIKNADQTASGTVNNGVALLKIPAGLVGPYTVTVVPVDGLDEANNTVDITASADMTYMSATKSVNVVNMVPVFKNVDEEGKLAFDPRSAMAPGSLSWTVTDPSTVDLKHPLTATVDFGDGLPAQEFQCNPNGGTTTITYTYKQASPAVGYNVVVTITDKDGATTSASGNVVVTDPTTALVKEYKRLGDGIAKNDYKALDGMGEGSIEDNKGTAKELVTAFCDWNMYYPGIGSVTYTANPEDFEEYNRITEKTEIFNSFVHVWIGNSFTFERVLDPNEHANSAMVSIAEGMTSFDVGAVFSRETYASDGVADIDADELPDGWEQKNLVSAPSESGGVATDTYPFETKASPYGTSDNADGDYLPKIVESVSEYGSFKLTKDSYDYRPIGLPFINKYEVRGIHFGLNADTNTMIKVEDKGNYGTYTVVTALFNNPDDVDNPEITPCYAETNTIPMNVIEQNLRDAGIDKWVVVSEYTNAFGNCYSKIISEDATARHRSGYGVFPHDEPHFGSYDADGNFAESKGEFEPYFGTNPAKNDTDGDLLSDGFEYYFWHTARFATTNRFEKYDPTKVITGVVLTNKLVEAAFNPCVPNSHVDMDIDGDGLSNFEEMLLGTNPCHWDTDGDKMNDGWEVMWGLNPCNPKDAGGNPDGDYMAAAGADESDLYKEYDFSGNKEMLIIRHSDVMLKYGFDPRTAWIKNNPERDGTGTTYGSPNTKEYTTFEEYYLGSWSIQHGIVDKVPPMSMMYMSQPVPYGTYRYVISVGEEKWDVTYQEVAAGGTGQGTDGSYMIPNGATSYQVLVNEITTHGSDMDNDGMPDGWELYVCADPETSQIYIGSIWPQGDAHASGHFDEDVLSNIEECHSTYLCDYYSSINTNFTANVNGAWYNKWWPTNPWNHDTDFDGLRDDLEGDMTFRYRESEDGRVLTLSELRARYGANTMLRGHVPGGGTNPCATDTDMDYIPDAWEYSYSGFNRDSRYEGGFINQDGVECSTSLGYITLVGGGMDATYFDSYSTSDECGGMRYVTDSDGKTTATNSTASAERNYDYDGDGLENYQEYLIASVAHLQYDTWVAGGTLYDPNEFFTTPEHWTNVALRLPAYYTEDNKLIQGYPETLRIWDWSNVVNDWRGEGGEVPSMSDLSYNFIECVLDSADFPLYASSDPRLADTDGDSMDDYYEMYHALNPILGDVFDIVSLNLGSLRRMREGDQYNFETNPWLAGAPNADPDQDGLPNWEEALSPNQPNGQNYNTDPSPYWFTDISNPKSVVNKYYSFGSLQNYWTEHGAGCYTDYPNPNMMVPNPLDDPRPCYIYSFEINEGFDTDNDNISDREELNGAVAVTDPQNSDQPSVRRTLYLDGNSAVRTRFPYAHGIDALRSWTVEAWIRPEEPVSGAMQVIIERPVPWIDGNNKVSAESGVRRTFRIALDEAGHPFVEFNNGASDLITESAKAKEQCVLEAGKWYHVAATLDGFKKQLSLYVNGELEASKDTALIPYTGFTTSADSGIGGSFVNPKYAPIVIGASDFNPSAPSGNTRYFRNGFEQFASDEEPKLGNFFKGHIDDVRIWSGPRPGGDDSQDSRVRIHKWPSIRDDYVNKKRYGYKEVEEALNDSVKYYQRHFSLCYDRMKDKVEDTSVTVSNVTVTTTTSIVTEGLTFEEYFEFAARMSQQAGGETELNRLPPRLIAAYNFDNLPDTTFENWFPKQFTSLDGRPSDYDGIQWVRNSAFRTTQYVNDPYKLPTTPDYSFVHNIENLVAHMPLGHLWNPKVDGSEIEDTEFEEIAKLVLKNDSHSAILHITEFRADHVADSKYWTRDSRGVISMSDSILGEGAENNFPNSANPYGETYSTGRSARYEIHPYTQSQIAFDPVNANLYNDLVPLMGARGDAKTAIWDGPADEVERNIDTDGDGLPDWWELQNGLDPYNADQNGNGVIDKFDDFDNDGLNNFAEYLAKLDPKNVDTDADGISDYFDKGDGGLSYGELYADGDHVLDTYEAMFDPAYASPYLYDEDADADGDGWNNWAEAIVGTTLAVNDYDVASSNTASYAESSVADKAKNFPMPPVNVRLNYLGGDLSGKLVIHAYDNADMNGYPTAILVRDFSSAKLGIWPLALTLTKEDVVYGHLRQGRNWFFAWIDTDGSNLAINGGVWPTWTPDEPAAIADYQLDGIEIGHDYNEVSFSLAGEAHGSVRISLLQPPNGSADVALHALSMNDKVVYIKQDGTQILNKTIRWPRTFIHEGDFMAGRTLNYGVNSGFASQLPNTYEVSVDGLAAGSVTNFFRKSKLTDPVLYSPVSYGNVNGGCPTFEFSIDGEATEFSIEVAKVDPGTGEDITVFSGRVPAPLTRNNDGTKTIRWSLPYAIGMTASNGVLIEYGMDYTWKVRAYNVAVKNGSAEVTGKFRVPAFDAVMTNGQSASVYVSLSYPTGWAYMNGNTPRILLEAFKSAGFNGIPAAGITLDGVGTGIISGLEIDGKYYLRAYIDLNGNSKRDSYEPYGYLRNIASGSPYAPVAVKAEYALNAVAYEILILDPDTDNDMIPDSAEWALYGSAYGDKFLEQSGLTDTTIKANLGLTSLSTSVLLEAAGDADNDGISDLAEIYFGLAADSYDSNSDGISDGDSMKLFGTLKSGSEEHKLAISGVSIGENGDLTLEWEWDDGKTSSGLKFASQDAITVTYVVEGKAELTDPAWTQIGEKVRISAADGNVVIPGGIIRTDGGARFFRIRFISVE